MTTTTVERRSGWIADDSTFGARLALVRQKKAWGNVKEAATACGLPVESWRNWERDNVVPRRVVTIAKVISMATGCDYLWLLLGSGDYDTRTTEVYSPGQRVVATAGQERPGQGTFHHHVPGRAVRKTQPRQLAFSAN